ncbi:spore germination protein [Tumebacillus sp. BK434]|uniref:spore germination protein n=1 Tax=Tumebacillus sp. BK434 TaxID=2512169 RepID=UPI001FB32847|nr:spore germination protein [Tumebacillus sp. BK434]
MHRKLRENQKFLEELFADSSDFVIRAFEIEKSRKAICIFVDGLVDTAQVNLMLKALMIDEGQAGTAKRISLAALPSSQITEVGDFRDLVRSVLAGDTGILIDGNDTGLVLGLRGGELRSVNEPETEKVVRGPREGFVENLRTNTALLRRKLRTPNLKMKPLVAGTESNTNLVVSYLEGIADPKVVDEVVGRLQKIEIDAILESGYVEELIQDSTNSPFPQVQYTERPDSVAAALLEGRVAIFIDGTPFVLIVPTTFWQLMQASEDYYERYQIATLVRWLRYAFLLISLFTPSLYIAVTTFHQAMLPTPLLLSIAAAREAIPFPAVVEAFIMEIAFEALREAGIRLPKMVGQAVSILGALVVGQAAVEAGIVSAPMVIIVSVTGIASFTIPRYNASIAFRMLRFPLMIAAALFGIYGIIIGGLFILGHLANLRSFGIPYLSPTGPLSVGDLKDVVIRAPWYAMKKRPEFLSTANPDRLGKDMQEEIERQDGQKGKWIEHGSGEGKA